MNTPGHIKSKLARIQSDIETLLSEQPFHVGPIEILELVAEALYLSEKPQVGYEVTDLVLRLREHQLGLSKKQSKPF